MAEHTPEMPSNIRTFLLRPSDFFEQRQDQLGGIRGCGLALVIAVATTAVLGTALRLFAVQFTGTTEIDNTARPPDQMCDGGTVGEMTVAGCDEPATRTVEIGSLIWDQATELFPFVFVVVVIGWVALAVLLYGGAKLAGGAGKFGPTMEVAAWGLLPSVVGLAIGGAVLVFFAASTDLSGSSPEMMVEQVQTLQAGLSGLTLLSIQVATAAWQAYVWAGGLRVVHEISKRAAVAVAIITATLPVVLS